MPATEPSAADVANDYGPGFAAIYDELFDARHDVGLVARLLKELAGDGPVLEFGVGTGRLAVPLASLGVSVTGVDNAPAMLEVLQRKAAGRVHGVLGSMIDGSFGGPYALVFVAFSSIYLIGGQEEQLGTFRNAARHLSLGGRFLVEGFSHDRTRFPGNQQIDVEKLTNDTVGLRIGLLDPAAQTIRSIHLSMDSSSTSFRPDLYRFIYPSEMDLMARLSGFRLEARWSDWAKSRFDGSSNYQIAVYQKVAEGPR